MDLSDTYTFNAPLGRVWDGDDRYRVRLNVALAAVSARYTNVETAHDGYDRLRRVLSRYPRARAARIARRAKTAIIARR